MRQASATAQAFLASRAPGFYADLFTVTLMDGTIFRWTSFDISITYAGTTWLAQGPMLERSAISVRNTIEVPDLRVTLLALDNDFIGGTNIKTQIHNGEFDGARLRLDRLPMTFPGDTSLGPPITMFGGRVGKADITATGAQLLVKGDVVIMNQYAPRNVFQSSCLWTFCDLGCKLLEANFTDHDTVAAGSTVSFIAWSIPSSNPKIYVHGKITFTGGVLNGESRSIVVCNAAGIIVSYPFLLPPAVGDPFAILRGCDKTLSTGSDQDCTAYNNTQHFRAFPFIPQPEYGL